ncbi:MAG: 50S ribosomal protein L29 [Patescibacteria group bacterium]|nr:50S ribosomal protein L29 [Patescibacteria group bacterium]
MKISEFRQKSNKELETLLRKNRENLRAMRFDLSFGKLKNVRQIRVIKKNIARILTIKDKK